ncbi:MAG: hypothetical protein P8163_20400 [Candidatus Thiodiazotropha sp.]
MESVKAAQLVEVHAGILQSLTLENETWRFTFEYELTVESYGGWCLYGHEFGAKRLIGSRDLLDSKKPFQRIKEIIDEATCEMIAYNAISNSTQLELARGDERLTLQLLANSAKIPNWKIMYGEVVETDIE